MPPGPNVEPPLQNRSLVFSSNITKTSVAYPGIARFNSNRNFSHSLAAPSKVCCPPPLRVLRGPKHGTGYTLRNALLEHVAGIDHIEKISDVGQTQSAEKGRAELPRNGPICLRHLQVECSACSGEAGCSVVDVPRGLDAIHTAGLCADSDGSTLAARLNADRCVHVRLRRVASVAQRQRSTLLRRRTALTVSPSTSTNQSINQSINQ